MNELKLISTPYVVTSNTRLELIDQGNVTRKLIEGMNLFASKCINEYYDEGVLIFSSYHSYYFSNSLSLNRLFTIKNKARLSLINKVLSIYNKNNSYCPIIT